MIRVTMEVDEPVLEFGNTTTVHVFAEIFAGPPGDGLYYYAIDALASLPGIARINSVAQFGDPFGASAGTIDAAGVHGVQGSDGGFFDDRTRGIGVPYELFAIEIQGQSVGDVPFSSAVANAAGPLGIPSGLSLLSADPGSVEFTGVNVMVTPEPATLALLAVGGLALSRSRKRHPAP